MKRLKLITLAGLIVASAVVLMFNNCSHGFTAINVNSLSSSSTSVTPPVTPPPVSRADAYNIGMNMPGITYWNNSDIYADATMQMCANNGPWDAQSGDAAAPLDSTGAPTVAAWSGFSADYPSGQYTVTWDGTGSIGVTSGGTMGSVTSTTANGVQENTATLTVTQTLVAPNPGSGAYWVQISATPPVTDVHIMAPQSMQDSTGFFMQDFLNKLRPFSTFRFMDAENTNGNLTSSWSQRSWPTAGARCGKTGMAYEDIVRLANATGKDIWINVPVLATDDYVCRLARLLRYGESGSDDNGSNCSLTAPSSASAGAIALNSSSKVYVEFSNEIWNWGFQQTSDLYCMANNGPASYSCTQNGVQTTCYHTCDVTTPPSAIAQAALTNPSINWGAVGYGRTEEMAMVLTKRDNDIFKTVFGDRASQIQTVINVQSAYAAEADSAFAFMQTSYGSVSNYMNDMAVAPYFNIDNDTASSGSGCYDCSVNGIFTDLSNNILNLSNFSDSNSTGSWLTQDLNEANKYGLPLVAYEGGQGMVGSNSTLNANDMAAQNDPRMYTATLQYLQLWDQLVGRKQLFNYYTFDSSYGQYGSWGALVNEEDPGSQKWDALITDVLTPGDANADGSVDQKDCAIVQDNWGKTGMWWSEGDFNHDGTVDANDLTILNAHITGSTCAAP